MICSFNPPYIVGSSFLWLRVVLCSLFMSAMYAGAFAFNRAHFCYCKGPPCTSPVFILIWFGLLVTFSESARSDWNVVLFNWTRLDLRVLRIRRVVRLIISIEQAMTLLRGIFVSLLPGIIIGNVGKDPRLWRKSTWLGKSWKKSFLAFQHQPPEWDESFRPELKQWLHRSVDVRERAIVLRCCGKIFGTRPDEGCLLTKDGHNRQLVTLCQESYCGGVYRPTLTKRPPQRLCCSPLAEPGNRGERLNWNNRSTMTAMQGADDLSGPLPSAFRLFTGTYLAPNPMTGKGCEALNIYILYLVLSKIQHPVGVNVFLQTLIKFTIYPMISDILF